MTADTTKPAPTGAPVKLPPWLRWHTVPRDVPLPVPTGWAVCGLMVAGGLQLGAAPFILSRELWPDVVRQCMDGVVVAAAVASTLRPADPICPSFFREGFRQDWVYARKPHLLILPPQAAVRVVPHKWKGEVLAWPVRRIDKVTR